MSDEGYQQFAGRESHSPPLSALLSAKPPPSARSAAGASLHPKTLLSGRAGRNPATGFFARSAALSNLEARRLKRGEERGVCDFLNRQPLRNVVMLSAVGDHGLEDRSHHGSFYGCFRQDQLIGVALIGRHVMLSGGAESVVVFANVARLCHEPELRMVLGEEETVAGFCQIFTQAPCRQAVRQVQPQALYALTQVGGTARKIEGLRRAQLAEQEEVVQVHARDWREQIGTDPLAQDPAGFRQRMRARIERGRVWIVRDESGIAFKTDIVAESDEAIYLEGIWVRPDLRGFGLGRDILKSLCRQLLRQHYAVCLFADADNRRVATFYQKVGFQAIGTYCVARFCPSSES
jgi:GNAT superfamily N-acetyltransferase